MDGFSVFVAELLTGFIEEKGVMDCRDQLQKELVFLPLARPTPLRKGAKECWCLPQPYVATEVHFALWSGSL